jgi:hypothetical protein
MGEALLKRWGGLDTPAEIKDRDNRDYRGQVDLEQRKAGMA